MKIETLHELKLMTTLSIIDLAPFMIAMGLLFGVLLFTGYHITRLFGPDESDDDDDWPPPE